MSTLAQIRTRAYALVQDVAGMLSETDSVEAVRQALARYTRDAPREVIEDLAGDGSAWEFDLGSDFVAGLSSVVRVEHPTGQRPLALMAYSEYATNRLADGSIQLTLPYVTPANGSTVRVTYTTAHAIKDLDEAEATTVPAYHEAGFVALAGAMMLQQAAGRMVHEAEAPLWGGDARDRTDKSSQAAKRASELLALYEQSLGVSGGVAPAIAVIDWDTSFGGTGVEHLTHRSRYR